MTTVEVRQHVASRLLPKGNLADDGRGYGFYINGYYQCSYDESIARGRWAGTGIAKEVQRESGIFARRDLSMRKTAFAWTAIVFVLSALATASGEGRADEVSSRDDGWRRTSQGWERSDGLSALGSASAQSRFVFGEEHRLAKPRWDVHPGLLVAAEVLLVSGAFLVWPRPRRATPAGSNGKEDTLGHPSRSDRAA